MSDPPPLLELRGVSVHFSGVRALTNVSFCAHPGEVRAVIGPNGAGKTTLFNAVTGYVEPTSGQVLFRGSEIQGRPPHAVAALGIRRTFQHGGLFGDLTVLENVLCGFHTQITSGVLGLLCGGRAAADAERQAVAQARTLLEFMGIGELENRIAKDLSGGQQRTVEITRALSTNAPLLLLDEPAVGLTPPVRDRLLDVIRRVAGERGTGVLLIEHSIDLVMKGSDVIVVLNDGQMIAEGTPEDIRKNGEVLDAYLGYG